MIVFDQVADSRIVGISFNREGHSVEFVFMNLATKVQWKLTASGLKELTGWDIRKSNILDRVIVYSGRECAQIDVVNLVRAARKGNGEDDSLEEMRLTTILTDQLIAGVLSLASFDAAFGAEFLIVAEKITFETLCENSDIL
jgi:hypothetical protein